MDSYTIDGPETDLFHVRIMDFKRPLWESSWIRPADFRNYRFVGDSLVFVNMYYMRLWCIDHIFLVRQSISWIKNKRLRLSRSSKTAQHLPGMSDLSYGLQVATFTDSLAATVLLSCVHVLRHILEFIERPLHTTFTQSTMWHACITTDT